MKSSENFIYQFQIDKDICDNLINYHKVNQEHKTIGHIGEFGKRTLNKDIKDSVDVIFYNNSNNIFIKKYFNELSKGLKYYCEKFDIVNVKTQFDNIISYFPKGGGFKTWHCERNCFGYGDYFMANRCLVYMTYLNDVTDKGETEFKYQNIKIKPKKGLTLIWPSDFTHTHRGIPSPTQEKWIATGWFVFV